MTRYTIAEIEHAINYWREIQQSDSDFTLSRPARILAEPYTQMILTHRLEIEASELSTAALQALRQASCRR